MTDGIIQETIDEYLKIQSLDNDTINILCKLGRVLTKRIKEAEKEFAENENLIPVSWLIGDNQE